MNKIKYITKSQYYTLIGLREVAKKYQEILVELEKSAQEITGEEDTGCGGHSFDYIYGSRDLDDMLRILEIEVK